MILDMGKILVTGALGQLGRELFDIAGSKKTFIWSDAILSEERPDVIQLDICNADAVSAFIAANKIDTVINCAAYTNVDKAEDDIELCSKINVDGPRNLAKALKGCDGALVHVSTDYVFDGTRKRGSYKPSNACHPTSVYGDTKRKGEVAIRRIGVRGVIIRTAWLYSPYGKNFVKTMLRLGAEKQEIGVVADQFGTPTYAHDLAQAILAILPQIGERRGEIYHFTDEGECSWFDLAAATMAYAGLSCNVKPLATSEYPTRAVRPARSVLDKSQIRDIFGVATPWWSTSLKACLKRIR